MTGSEQKRLANENDKLKEDFQALQRYADTTAQDNRSLQNELGEMRTNLLDTRRELEETQQREQRLMRQQKEASLNGCASVNGTRVNGNATPGSENVVFSPAVAKSLAAITAKMNELEQDLICSGLDMEHDDISALLGRAQQMVPRDIFLDCMESATKQCRGRGPAPRLDALLRPPPSTQMQSPEKVIPSPQRNLSPQAITPRVVSPQRQVSAPITRQPMQTVSPTSQLSYLPKATSPKVTSGFGVMSLGVTPHVVRPPLSAAPLQVQSHPQAATLVPSVFA